MPKNTLGKTHTMSRRFIGTPLFTEGRNSPKDGDLCKKLGILKVFYKNSILEMHNIRQVVHYRDTTDMYIAIDEQCAEVPIEKLSDVSHMTLTSVSDTGKPKVQRYNIH